MLYEELEQEVALLREQMDFVLEVMQAILEPPTTFEDNESEAPNARD